MIACDEYEFGPEYRYLRDNDFVNPKDSEAGNRAQYSKSLLEENTVQVEKSQIQPFDIKVCPDATFMTDLHAHLSNSEIIGLLGGDFNESEKCLYVQAAFPCKSTPRYDSGFTDVEMDPLSQLLASDAIRAQGMKVVGWYHSHPTFQPDPSVTDIQNQGSYQSLFQTNSNNPFVGLIVGTYHCKFVFYQLTFSFILFHTNIFLTPYLSAKSIISVANAMVSCCPEASKYHTLEFE